MSEFWFTVYTMQDIYGEAYQAFTLFGAVHLSWLVLCLAVCLIGCLLFRRMSQRQRKKLLLGAAIAIAAVEAGRQTVIFVTGQWRPETLPLHLCSINIAVCLWYSLRPNRLAGNILYALCLPGAAMALLSPSWLALPVWNFCHIASEVLHILLLLYPLLLVTGGFRPGICVLPKVAAFLIGLCAVIYPLNRWLGTNFMFLNDPNGNALSSVCSAIFGEKYYLIGFVLILLAIFFVLYLPYVISDMKKGKLPIN